MSDKSLNQVNEMMDIILIDNKKLQFVYKNYNKNNLDIVIKC